MKLRKHIGGVIVLICIAVAVGFWVHGRLTDPQRRLRADLGRDVVEWYFVTLSIRKSGFDSLRPEPERIRLESDRKKAWGIPSEATLFEEETGFQDILHDELLFKYTATFTYPGQEDFVVVTETYFADAASPPLPIKREIVDTKANPKIRSAFLWDGAFNGYLAKSFGCRVVK